MHINEITKITGKMGPTRKRLGRGIGSGQGKTAGRGHKGAGSRSGSKARLAHEGGQMPLFRRVAKRGFSPGFTNLEKFVGVVNVGRISEVVENGAVVGLDEMVQMGLIPSRVRFVRVLGGGDVSKVIHVKANYISRSAAEKLRQSSGTFESV